MGHNYILNSERLRKNIKSKFDSIRIDDNLIKQLRPLLINNDIYGDIRNLTDISVDGIYNNVVVQCTLNRMIWFNL